MRRYTANKSRGSRRVDKRLGGEYQIGPGGEPGYQSATGAPP